MNEIDLVERIRKQVGKSTLELGIGDDCAIYRPRPNEDLLFTTDYLIEDVHFRRDLFPPDAVGHKALARSLSDIAAMGGEPRFCLLSLALPPSADQLWVDQFLNGFLKLAKRCGTTLAGGDLSRASKVTCDVMVCGAVPRGKALRRDGAKPGDAIYVSGPLGKPWQKHQRPEPRLDVAKKLRGRASSCMDLSDGISIDLSRLIKASRVGATLDHVPMVKGSTIEEALHGGEDYELLYTMSKRKKPLPGSIRVGEITDHPVGQIEFHAGALEPLGHDHFRKETGSEEVSAAADPRVVLDLIEAFRRSKTMFAALELGVFEGKREGKEIDRLLAACGSLGLLEKRSDGEWINTPAADEYLRKDSPRTLSGYIEYSNMALYPMWGHLEDAVREGSHRWKQTFGFEGGIFSSFFKSDEARDRFLMGMHGFGQLSSPAVARAFDLSGFQKLVDLGGASGHLAMAAVAAYPNLKAAVFDLPQAIEFARHFVEGTNVELITGDFFTDPLPPADLYALGRILHDWSDDKIPRLLNRIYDALPPVGGLLIAEKLLGPTHVSAHMQSLSMLVCTEGRERTLDEYRVLLEAAGFRDIEGVITGAPLDAIIARKP